MITREQVADLQPGDVVEVVETIDGDDFTTRGPLRASKGGESLTLGDFSFRAADGAPAKWFHTLTVVSRAPRPLYANHPRTEAKQHDVIRDGQGVIRHCDPTGWGGQPTWWSWEVEPGFRWTHTTTPPQPLTLLVDGELGQVVP